MQAFKEEKKDSHCGNVFVRTIFAKRVLTVIFLDFQIIF